MVQNYLETTGPIKLSVADSSDSDVGDIVMLVTLW